MDYAGVWLGIARVIQIQIPQVYTSQNRGPTR